MDFAKLLQEAEAITDPVEREAAFNRISRMMLGAEPTPARQAATSPVVDKTKRPTVENAALLEELKKTGLPRVEADPVPQYEQLIAEQKLADKVEPGQRLSALNDDELIMMAEGFSSLPTEQFRKEITDRKDADENGYLHSKVGINRLAGQVVGGAAEISTVAPIALAGFVARGAELLAGNTPLLLDPKTGETRFEANDILKAASDISEDVRSAVGISEPRNIRETLAALVPSVTPIGIGPEKFTKLGSLIEAATPLVVGSGNKRIIANFATQFVMDQALRELGDDKDTAYKTAFDVLPGEDKSHPWAYDAVMSGLGLFTAGTMIPAVSAQAMKTLRKSSGPPKLVNITDIDPHGPKNLKSSDTVGELYALNILDEKSVLTHKMEKLGFLGIDDFKRQVDQDTQVAGVMRVNEAMRTGSLHTAGGKFTSTVSPEKLYQEYRAQPEQERINIDLYMKYKHLSDNLHKQIQNKKGSRNAAKQLVDVNKAIHQLETTSPVVKQFHKQYTSVIGAVRSYQAQGPNAMHTQAELARLAKEDGNFVPIETDGVDPRGNLLRRIADGAEDYKQKALDNWYLGKSRLTNIADISKYSDSFDTMMEYTRNALKHKMENDVRGALVRGLKTSLYGRDTIRKKTAKDVDMHPKRLLYVYENGERVPYLTSELTATLARFDPYVAKFPVMYGFKRGFENLTTGFLSTFAPTTLIRDTIAGNVLMPDNLKGPGGPIDVGKAVFKQNWAHIQKAAIDILDSSLDIPWMTPQNRRQLASQISSAYMNSTWHLAQSVGGFDGSIAQTSIQNAKGAMAASVKAMNKQIADSIPRARAAGRSLAALGRGWINLLDSLQEAPRFSVVDRNLKPGMSMDQVSDVVREAKKITGDTMRSGRVYNPDGTRISADAINREALVGHKQAAWLIEAARETTPYFNPAVQGLRRLGTRMIEDPVGTNLRAWSYVGLPAMVAYAWNEMLGDEYNKFAFEERSSRDIAMNMHIGIPGLPPEQGAQIPLPHELIMFMSPWTTALHAMNKGAEGEEVGAMMKHMAGTVLENAVNIGFPQALGAIGSAVYGEKSPKSINPLSWADDTYQLREDNLGIFPQNVEEMLRSAWGATGQLVANSVAAGWEGGPDAFFNEMGYGIAKSLPVVKNVMGYTTPVANFTPLSEIKQSKIDATDQFDETWTTHFKRPNIVGGDLALNTKRDGTPFAGTLEDGDGDQFTKFRMSPLAQPKPDNPIYEMFGPQIHAELYTNTDGYTALKDRSDLLSKQLKQLKTYTAGKTDAIEEYKKEYVGADARYKKAMAKFEKYEKTLAKPKDRPPELKQQVTEIKEQLGHLEEKAKFDRLIKELDLDLTKREDVLALVSILEREKIEIMQKQVSIIESLEDKINGTLKAQGLIRPDVRFKMEKHLGPNKPKDLFVQ